MVDDEEKKSRITVGSAIKVASGAYILSKTASDLRDTSSRTKNLITSFFSSFKKKKQIENRGAFKYSVFSSFAGSYLDESGNEVFVLDAKNDPLFVNATRKRLGLSIGGDDFGELFNLVFSPQNIETLRHQALIAKRIYAVGSIVVITLMMPLLALGKFKLLLLAVPTIVYLVSLAISRDSFICEIDNRSLFDLKSYFKKCGFFGWFSWD
jgi:hypothetical protein